MAFLAAIPLLGSLFAGGGAATAAAGTAAAADIGLTSTGVASTLAATAGATGFVPAAAGASSWLGTASLASTLAGSAISGIGLYGQSQAASEAAKYNAAVASVNSQQAKQNAVMSGESGAIQAGVSSEKTKAAVGSIIANQGAAGLDVNRGSDVDVKTSAKQLGAIDALTIRSNAVKEAYGYQVQSTGYQAESALDQYEAASDITAGQIGAASTFLGGASSAASQYYKYQLAGGMGAG